MLYIGRMCSQLQSRIMNLYNVRRTRQKVTTDIAVSTIDEPIPLGWFL
jgi:hypothetical protein